MEKGEKRGVRAEIKRVMFQNRDKLEEKAWDGERGRKGRRRAGTRAVGAEGY